jgi:propanol-preferring alcohol dehydrogenase
MLAYRLLGWQQPPELVEVPVPAPGPGEVLVEVAGCGLCHSDLTMVAIPSEFGAALGWEVPFTLGHETAGRVAQLGEGVTGVVAGDAVALTSPSSCGRCPTCLAGRESACPSGDAGRGYGRDGGLAGYVVAPMREVLPLGPLDPRTAGPLTDAGATSHHAVRRARPELGAGSTVVVVGVGGLGWFTVQILKATTPARIVAVDIDPARRAIATELGADAVVDGGSGRELREALAVVAGGDEGGVDAVIDIVGTDATIAAGLGALRRGGAFVLVGSGGGGFPRPWFGGLPREATITAVQGSSIDDARQVIALAADGRVKVEVDEYPLERVADAYAALDAGTLRGRALVIP